MDEPLARIDMDEWLAHIDTDEPTARIDMDEWLAHIDMDGQLARSDTDELVAYIDMDEWLARIDTDEPLSAYIDMDEWLARIDVDDPLARSDIDRQLVRVNDMDKQLALIDMDEPLEGEGSDMGEPLARIAVFYCGEGLVRFDERYGDGAMVLRQWLAGTAPEDYVTRMVLDTFGILEGEYPEEVDEYTAVIISGPTHGIFEEDAGKVICRLVSFVRDMGENHPEIKLIGLGLGHHIVAAAFGQNAEPRAWEAGPYDITLTAVGRAVFGRDTMVLPLLHQEYAFDPDLTDRLREIGGGASTKSAPFHIWGHTRAAPAQGVLRFSEHYDPGAHASLDELLANVRVLTCLARPDFVRDMMRALVGEMVECNGIPEGVVREVAKRDEEEDENMHGGWFGETVWEVILGDVWREARVDWAHGEQNVVII